MKDEGEGLEEVRKEKRGGVGGGFAADEHVLVMDKTNRCVIVGYGWLTRTGCVSASVL